MQRVTYGHGGGGASAVHGGGSGGVLGGPVSLLEGGDGGGGLPVHLQIDSMMGIILTFLFVRTLQ